MKMFKWFKKKETKKEQHIDKLIQKLKELMIDNYYEVVDDLMTEIMDIVSEIKETKFITEPIDRLLIFGTEKRFAVHGMALTFFLNQDTRELESLRDLITDVVKLEDWQFTHMLKLFNDYFWGCSPRMASFWIKPHILKEIKEGNYQIFESKRTAWIE